MVEKRLRENLKLKDLKVLILSTKRTQKEVATTTKYRKDEKLIKAAIRENERLKDLQVREPEKQQPRVIFTL